ncbi:MAG TPA: hypothetical protein VH165_16615, partial [Kofleriaceae bacterium]|nr:hypothetical protein [Kofleriaceae bacterium]
AEPAPVERAKPAKSSPAGKANQKPSQAQPTQAQAQPTQAQAQPSQAQAQPSQAQPAGSATPEPDAPRRTTAHVAPRRTPTGGSHPVTAQVTAAAAAPPSQLVDDDSDDTTAEHTRVDAPWPKSSEWDERTERVGPPLKRPVLPAASKGFAPALTPPAQVAAGTARNTALDSPARSAKPTPAPRAAKPTPAPVRSDKPTVPVAAPVTAARYRPPTEPEIETYLELEADLPPESGDDGALGQALGQVLGQAPGQALGQALGQAPGQALGQAPGAALAFGSAPRIPRDEIDDEYAAVSITIEDDTGKVTEPAAELAPAEPPIALTRSRRITAEDAVAVSGTIEEPPPQSPPPRRAKRHSGGYDD